MSKYDLKIQTERLLIRPFTVLDIEASYAMNLDEDVNKFTGDGGVVSLEEIRRRITEDVLGDYQKHGFGRLAVELKSNGRFIGFVGLKYLEDIEEVDLGYRFISECWGKGYATESAKACVDLAFNTLELNEITAFVLPENKASTHVLKKLGFSFQKEFIEDGELAHKFILKK